MSETYDSLFVEFQKAVAGRYSLERELGRGGMGIVYLARDVSLDRPVALKLLPPALGSSVTVRDRFVQEAQTAARLSHPNIVAIHAVDQSDGFVYFVMAYVEGETLGTQIARRGPLPARVTTRLIREVAWALAHAHAEGIIHRDIKPDNILLERSTGRALVSDFGIAGTLETAGASLPGDVRGTPEFMSPEQAMGEPVDGRSDLYSLGVVGYYTAAGKLPFAADDPADLLACHISEPAPPLLTVAGGIPQRLARTIDRCLAKDPVDRFPTGAELAEALTLALEERKEIPVAVRAFLTESRNNEGRTATYLFTSALVLPMTIGLTTGRFPWPVNVLGLGLTGLWILSPVITRWRRIRRLLKAGYTREDLIGPLRHDAERRHEELAYTYGRTPTRFERALRRVAYGSLAVTGGLTAAAFLIPGVGTMAPFIGAYGLAMGTGVTTSLIARSMTERRRDVRGERRLRFWRGRVGKWLGMLASVGISRARLTGTHTHRPTELQLGIAAEALFRSLPADSQRAVADLPDVIRQLEQDAQALRGRLDELNQALAGSPSGAPFARSSPDTRVAEGLVLRRRALYASLEEERGLTERRLADTVASLETIRLGLLRLRGGVATVETLTQDLAAAKDAHRDVELLRSSHRELDAFLGAERPT